jgi:hypothetical protein
MAKISPSSFCRVPTPCDPTELRPLLDYLELGEAPTAPMHF